MTRCHTTCKRSLILHDDRLCCVCSQLPTHLRKISFTSQLYFLCDIPKEEANLLACAHKQEAWCKVWVMIVEGEKLHSAWTQSTAENLLSRRHPGPPDVLTFDPGPNFRATEFHAEARLLGISCNQIPVEAHWAVGKIERFHAPLRRAYEIIRAECGTECSQGAALQAAVKAVNDTAGPNGLVPTLLVFGAMPRITMDSPPTPSQTKRAAAVNKAMTELRKLTAKRKLNDALAARNGPELSDRRPRTLELGAEVLVYREKGNWSGPYKVVSVTENNVRVALPNGDSDFRSTHVKPYHRYQDQEGEAQGKDDFIYPEENQPRPRGRPKAVPKAPKELSTTVAADPTQKPPPDSGVIAPEADTTPNDRTIEVATEPEEHRRSGRSRKPKVQFDTLISDKENRAYELAVKYRAEGKITAPGAPFEQSDAAEIEALLGAGVLQPVSGDNARGRIFGARMVREVKGTPERPYEKSRLVVQGHSDQEKKTLLTQAPTIMRCSQRLILSITPSLMERYGYKLMIRDISQAYTQSKSQLMRDVLVRIPRELQHRYPRGTYLKVHKPLYGLAESGLHWFDTYQRHHKERLNCKTSIYDTCLLMTKSSPFGLVGLQTDDTLNLGDPDFIAAEEAELQRAGLLAKPQRVLQEGDTEDFNGCKITLKNGTVVIRQKGQADRLEQVKIGAADRKQQYVAQRARGAYIATICQPEAAFDLSVAAQAKEPTDTEIETLNKRIQWQIDNKLRGLTYIPLDMEKAKLYVFVDGSLANLVDMSSQIGYLIVLGTETNAEDNAGFEVQGNIVHWSSVKCSRITRSSLASEIYGMTGGLDLGYVLARTLGTICQQINLPSPELVICTDSKSLYECLVRLGTTLEKRLMIDILAIRQSYENREIQEIR
ncbi:hypothetical protein OOU_Y34scaffold01053g4 [Pyricularia oryzae Y34]|uniref:Integrase catalytic domain-containing protein n=1 Tax=Pyricularia oryzae (strain Y34) TaxID=1143189 RepID=A0AA97NM66_PYRO3|nr:hypothetical protein OOU_Y34scaffold01053g4 [Pyricularia oryzae Y34]